MNLYRHSIFTEYTLQKHKKVFNKLSMSVMVLEEIGKDRTPGKVTNEEVPERTGEKTTLVNNILHRKDDWVSHILRINACLHILLNITDVKE